LGQFPFVEMPCKTKNSRLLRSFRFKREFKARRVKLVRR
jgi:U3 small nucleolar RNA-associated protein 14